MANTFQACVYITFFNRDADRSMMDAFADDFQQLCDKYHADAEITVHDKTIQEDFDEQVKCNDCGKPLCEKCGECHSGCFLSVEVCDPTKGPRQ